MKRKVDEEVDEEFDISDSQINEYKEITYRLLKFRTHKIRAPDGKFKCPFCANKEEVFQYTLFLQHAIQVAEGSEDSAKQRANHSAMATYLAIDLANEAEPSPQSSTPLQASESNDDFKNALDSVQECYQRMVEKLKEKEGDLCYFISKDHQSNGELQEIRKALIELLKEVPSQSRVTTIGIKKMGELDQNFFLKACQQWYPTRQAHIWAAQLCSLWQEKMKNPHWHPFQVQDSKGGITQRLVKEDDELLKGLKKEWGEQIHNAVVTALEELNEYNSSGCYPVPELWNFNTNRKATSVEVINYIVTQLRSNKRKRG